MRLATAAALLGACAGPPWFMGRPELVDDGALRRPVLADVDATPVPSSLRARAGAAWHACRPARELAALVELSRRVPLRTDEQARLAVLLDARADALAVVGRVDAAARDRRHARSLAVRRPSESVCAGDAVAVTPALVAGRLRVADQGSQDDLAALAAIAAAEDPGWSEAQFAAARLAVAAGRLDWADRLITDAIAVAQDRPRALAESARQWESAGEPRRACRRWLERARLAGATDEAWEHLLGCTARDPSMGDPERVRRYVQDATSGVAPRSDASVP